MARPFRYDARMRWWAVRLVEFVSLVSVVAVAGESLSAQQRALERAIAAAEALGARTGVAVCDAGGDVLWRHRATEAFAPASNMKVLTAAAVVSGLGAAYTFRTEFRLERGRLVVVASGDPNWLHDTAHDGARVFADV